MSDYNNRDSHSQLGGAVSSRTQLDPRSQQFHHNWTRPKRAKSQVNGHTEMSQSTIKLKSMAKAHRF